MHFVEPPLTFEGRPTTIEGGDAAALRGGKLLFVRRPNTIIGEIPFSEPVKTFRLYMEWLAKRHDLECVPYDPARPEPPAVRFKPRPMDALVESS